MAYIRRIDEDRATGTLKRIYDEALAREGRVSDIIKVMSLDEPTTSRAMQMYVSLMKSENALDAATREMIGTVVSNVNGCYY